MRRCTKTACGKAAVATLTYNYADQTVVVGRLSTYAEPHSYDLCHDHAQRLTVPQGWEIVRLVLDPPVEIEEEDDLTAVLNAVRRPTPTRLAAQPEPPLVEGARRGHLWALREH